MKKKPQQGKAPLKHALGTENGTALSIRAGTGQWWPSVPYIDVVYTVCAGDDKSQALSVGAGTGQWWRPTASWPRGARAA